MVCNKIGCQWCSNFHVHRWTASIWPILLFSPCRLCFLRLSLFFRLIYTFSSRVPNSRWNERLKCLKVILPPFWLNPIDYRKRMCTEKLNNSFTGCIQHVIHLNKCCCVVKTEQTNTHNPGSRGILFIIEVL